MPSYAYNGDHAAVNMYGVMFPRGEAVEIDGNAMLERKLPGHPEFSKEDAEDAGEVDGGTDAKPSDGLTVPQIKDALAEKGIAIPDGVTKKADLAALLDA